MENEIKKARKKTGLSQNEVCDLFEIPHGSYVNWEQGRRKCPTYTQASIIDQLEEIAHERRLALNLDPDGHTLSEITQQESGIIIFEGKTDEIIICNWAAIVDDNVIYRVFCNFLVEFPQTISPQKPKYVPNVFRKISSCRVIYDENGDIDVLSSQRVGGIEIEIADGIKVIAPFGWN